MVHQLQQQIDPEYQHMSEYECQVNGQNRDGDCTTHTVEYQEGRYREQYGNHWNLNQFDSYWNPNQSGRGSE